MMHTVSYMMTLAAIQWGQRHRVERSRNGGLYFFRWGIVGGSVYVSFR